ncbi:hypothetical protein Lalb_Chr01g0012551 [Lupinus albus]|uniref:Uncharacterized protein n=1 Tax=Lupinus albus TaxID=3870 RepID=A0A6A4R5J4_LUPAL|nr:hypothetical protein Lalb_Chr01g0012551 [Lupinus albus]
MYKLFFPFTTLMIISYSSSKRMRKKETLKKEDIKISCGSLKMYHLATVRYVMILLLLSPF